MNNKITILLTGIIAVAISLFLGYLWGRSSVELPAPKRIVEVKWEKGEVVRDTFEKPAPYEVKVPDSIPIFIPTDTAALFAIWQDYYLERKYALDFSNDSLGTFKVDAKVSQNKLISATSFIQTNIRTVYEKEVIYKVPTIQPWAMIGTSIDFRTNKLQFGLDLKNKYVIGVSGLRIEDKYGYTLDFGIKFR
jgi:hypothetical protein